MGNLLHQEPLVFEDTVQGFAMLQGVQTLDARVDPRSTGTEIDPQIIGTIQQHNSMIE
jgi:hypothetical protein